MSTTAKKSFFGNVFGCGPWQESTLLLFFLLLVVLFQGPCGNLFGSQDELLFFFLLLVVLFCYPHMGIC